MKVPLTIRYHLDRPLAVSPLSMSLTTDPVETGAMSRRGPAAMMGLAVLLFSADPLLIQLTLGNGNPFVYNALLWFGAFSGGPRKRPAPSGR